MPKISIIIPVYNVEKYVGDCIKSVIKQSMTDIELILVDDGSLDESGKICDTYAAEDSRIRVIHKKNGGVGAARNDGLKQASGDWVIFCDSDDWMEPNALQELVEAGEKSHADVVFGDVNLVYSDKVKRAVFYKDTFVTKEREIIDKLIAADFCKTYCFNPSQEGPAFGYGGPWNKLVRRQLLIESNITFDLRVKGIFDDILYTAYIFANANIVQYTHAVVYNYRQLGTSITHGFKGNLIQINSAIFHSWDEFLDRYGSDGRFRKPYLAMVMRRFRSLFDYYFFHDNNTKPLKEQLSELDSLIKTDPYCTAIKEADSHMLANRMDKLLQKVARSSSARTVWLAVKVYYSVMRFKA